MNRGLLIPDRVEADIDCIFHRILPRSAQRAIAWFLALSRAFDRIVETPELFSLASESSAFPRELREAFFKTRRGRTYRIVFEVSGESILIIRVRGPGQAPLRRSDLPDE